MDQHPDGSRLQLDRARDEELVQRWRAGDERAFGELYDAWFDRVHDLALRLVGDPARAADIAQEAFLSAWQRIDSLEDPAAFGGWLLRIGRNRALNVLDKERRATVVDDLAFRAIEAEGSPVNAPDGFRVAGVLADEDDPARAVGDQEVVELLWAAADALGERDRTVLHLQLRHGFLPAEIGEIVGVNRNAANQLVHRVKQRLAGAVSARLLWRGEAPTCARLLAELETAGVAAFDQQAVTIANRHAEDCDECGDRQRIGLRPAALFGAVPIAIAPVVLKQEAAAALESAGVPMSGSAYSSTPSLPGGTDSGATGGRGAGDATLPGTTTGTGPATSAAMGGATAATVASTDEALGAERAGPPTAASRDGSSEDGDDLDAEHGARGRRALVAAAVILLLLAGGGIVLATGDDDEPTDLATATTGPEPTTTVAEQATPGPTGDERRGDPSGTFVDPAGHPTTTTTLATTTTSALVVVPPPPPPPPGPTTTTSPGPTTTTIPPTASISVSDSTPPPVFPMFAAPVLTWSTAGGASVEVSGLGVSSSSPSASVAFCPGTITSSLCTGALGTHTYTVRVFDADGDLLIQRSVDVTVM
jgi:RNA polymerase sigma factor (sigma-70 family)